MAAVTSPIYISGWGSISPLGCSESEVSSAYQSGRSLIRPTEVGGRLAQVAALSEAGQKAISDLIGHFPSLRDLDRSALLAVEASRQALLNTGWIKGANSEIGVNIGSSRGATSTLERFHQAFLDSGMTKTPTLTSPLTTLGTISTTVAQTFRLNGPAFSHSITCNSAIHAIANACAWLRAGMASKFLVGGSEAALTPFTIAQMKGLRLYAPYDQAQPFPCRPFDRSGKANTLVLGEGAAVFALQTEKPDSPTAYQVESIGYALDDIPSGTGVSEYGNGFRIAMKRAIDSMVTDSPVDALIAHAPGTIKGDAAEFAAIKDVFGDTLPLIVSNKWHIGHTFGASGALSLELALLALQGMPPPQFPYPNCLSEQSIRKIRKVMINAAGFGGNCTSLIVSIAS